MHNAIIRLHWFTVLLATATVIENTRFTGVDLQVSSRSRYTFHLSH